MRLAYLTDTEESQRVTFQADDKFFVVDLDNNTTIATVASHPDEVSETLRDANPDGTLYFKIGVNQKFIDWLSHKGYIQDKLTTSFGKSLSVTIGKPDGIKISVLNETLPVSDLNTRFVLYLVREYKKCSPILLPGTQLPKASADVVDGVVWYPTHYVVKDIDNNYQYLADVKTTQDGYIRNDDKRLKEYTLSHSGSFIRVSESISVLTNEGIKVFGKSEVPNYVTTRKGVFIQSADVAKALGYVKNSDGTWSILRDEINERIIPWKPGTKDIGNYHGSGGRFDMTNGEDWVIGLEIEKEDKSIKDRISAKQLKDTYGWTVERDGSLSDAGGFELISPKLPLFSPRVIENHLESLREVIDCGVTTACGGHIHMSCRQMNSTELFDRVSGFFPLLYAMYPERAALGTCKADRKESLKQSGGKHQAIHLTSYGTVEFRIFPGVGSVESIQRRLTLLRFMANNIDMTYDQVLANLTEKGELFDMLRSHYGRVDYNNIIDRLVYYTELFEKKTLTPDFSKIESI